MDIAGAGGLLARASISAIGLIAEMATQYTEIIAGWDRMSAGRALWHSRRSSGTPPAYAEVSAGK